MQAYYRLLAGLIVAALTLVNSPTRAQRWWRQPQVAIPGGLLLPLPDLVITSTSAKLPYKCGPYTGSISTTISATVKNIGSGPAILPKSQWAAWIGAVQLMSSGGAVPGLGEYNVVSSPPWLLPGETKTLSWTMIFYQAFAGGGYFAYWVYADPFKLIKESDEDNNWFLGNFAITTVC